MNPHTHCLRSLCAFLAALVLAACLACPALADALFIPPMSPAVRKIEGIVTVNGAAKICTCERQQI